MEKEKETGDGTLDRFSHYPYAPSTSLRPGGPNVPTGSDASLENSSHPVSNNTQSVLKRNHINISSYAFPPGFIVDPSVGTEENSLNNILKGNPTTTPNNYATNPYSSTNGQVVLPPIDKKPPEQP